MDEVRKADDSLSSGTLFSSTVEDAMRQVVLHRDNPNPPPQTQGPQGHVEYWKAQCGESRTLCLGGGKGRKPLPIRTK
jgi:hypothetical protein